MTNDEMIAVIEVHKHGAKIETRNKDSSDAWTDSSEPVWDFYNSDYRIKSNLSEILNKICEERKRQDDKWGRSKTKHSIDEFLAFIEFQMLKMLQSDTPLIHRKRLINISAIAVAAIESIDRKTTK